MGSQQQFCLRWNNHQSNLLNIFEELLDSEILVDVTLACDGVHLKAHKVVLSACSPYFKQLFRETPCTHPIVVLKDVRYADLRALVEFMYKGEVNVSQDQLSTLLKTADTLKIKGLAEVTEGIADRELTNGHRGDTADEGVPRRHSIQSSQQPRPSTPPPPLKRRKKRRSSGGSAGIPETEGGSDSMDMAVTAGSSEPATPDGLPLYPKTEIVDTSYDEEGELSCALDSKEHGVGGTPSGSQYLPGLGDGIRENDDSQSYTARSGGGNLSDSNFSSLPFPQSSTGDPGSGSLLRGAPGDAASLLVSGDTTPPNTSATSTGAGALATSGSSPNQGDYMWMFASTSHEKKQLKCNQCGQGFQNSSNLARHKKFSRCSGSINLFHCPYCPKTYTWRDNLKYHIKMTHVYRTQ